MGGWKARLAAPAFAAALVARAQPAWAQQGLGERIVGTSTRSSHAVGRAAERAGSATGAAADRSLAWARREVRGVDPDGERSSARSRR